MRKTGRLYGALINQCFWVHKGCNYIFRFKRENRGIQVPFRLIGFVSNCQSQFVNDIFKLRGQSFLWQIFRNRKTNFSTCFPKLRHVYHIIFLPKLKSQKINLKLRYRWVTRRFVVLKEILQIFGAFVRIWRGSCLWWCGVMWRNWRNESRDSREIWRGRNRRNISRKSIRRFRPE